MKHEVAQTDGKLSMKEKLSYSMGEGCNLRDVRIVYDAVGIFLY